MHGSFSRAEHDEFMAAIGPDFKADSSTKPPVSNPTSGGQWRTFSSSTSGERHLLGRVIGEALPGGPMPQVEVQPCSRSRPRNGLRTILNLQQVGANTLLPMPPDFPAARRLDRAGTKKLTAHSTGTSPAQAERDTSTSSPR